MNEQSIFTTAISKKTAEERRAFLDEACGDNSELRAQMEELLAADAAAGSYFEHPPTGVDVTVDASLSGKDTVDNELSGSLPLLEPCDKPDRIGKLDHYEIIELVGQGGMGTVLRAFDTKLSRIVAVKVMAPELAANPHAVKRFLREAQTAAAVHHDHVVTIHAIDDSHRPPFIVMQFVEGQTLQQKIDKEGALELKQILRIGSQMAAGLAAAHKTGLIHRDVKPGNILLENGVERVKITDFGLARAADDVEMTKSGMIAGTPQYMSPEQAHGEQIDSRSDLFSLGSVLYTMCTGRPAFRAETTMGTLRRVCDDMPRPIHEVNAEIPDWLEAIVMKLLAKKPEDRFQSAKEVAELLEQHLAHVQNPAQVPRPMSVSAAAIESPKPTKPHRGVKMVPLMVPQGIRWPLIAAAAIFLFLAVLLTVVTEIAGITHLFNGSGQVIVGPSALLPSWPPTVEPSEAFEAGEWVKLFNGQDLTGWRTIPGQNWRVENGAIHGSGPDGFLFTAVGGFEDFYLVAEYRINETGDSGIHFRAPQPKPNRGARWGYTVTGMEAEVSVRKAAGYRSGALTVKDPDLRVLATSSAPAHAANEWARLEIIALQDRIQILVNGKLVTDYLDKERKFQRGHIALCSWEGNNIKTNVEFRKVEIKKLPANWPGAGNAPPLAVAPFDSAQAKVHQDVCARQLGVDVEITNSVGMKMRLIPSGEFLMGQTQEETDRLVQSLEQGGVDEFSKFVARFSSPQHKVRITQPFYLGACEVTVGQYRKFIDEMKYVGTIEQLGIKRFHWTSSAAEPNPEERAVIGVSWDDAKAFCKWLSQQDGLTYDLPSEAQWEFACRAGTDTRWSFGDEASGLEKYVVCGHASFWPAEVVGSKASNPFGLFDMHGNADEWCLDWHHRDFYAKSPTDDPVNLNDPKDKTAGRVARGGAAVSAPWWTRSTTRAYDFPATPSNPKGFRVAIVVGADLAKIQARKVKTKEQPPQTASSPPRAVAPFDAAKAKEHQDAWAKHLGVEPEITNSIGMKLRVIPPGEFTMGATGAEIKELEPLFAAPAVKYLKSAGPAHIVRITRPMALGVDEVTVGQFAAFVKDTGHVTLAEKQGGAGAPNELGIGTFQQGKSWKEPGWAQTDEFPVVGVSWHDAVAFCEWLSKKETRQYRLPTEAEWEYACRAGTTTLSGFGPVVNAEQAVFGRGVQGRPEPVGGRAGNAFGIRDMHGNVHEWCLDSYHEKYYQVSPMADPPGPFPCPERVLRGQAFDTPVQRCISAYRFGRAPEYRAITMGFRVTLVDVAPAESELEKHADAGWTPLFNGKDLTGWKVHPSQPNKWKVEDGVLVGTGGHSHLFSERGDYRDFELRLEARISEKGNSGVMIRSEYGFDFDLTKIGGLGKMPRGMEVDLHPGIQPEPAGSIWHLAEPDWMEKATRQLVRPDRWFTLHILAQGKQLEVKIDGITVIEKMRSDLAFDSGHIALLQQMDGAGKIEFRKIEIREFSPAELSFVPSDEVSQD